MYFKKETTNLEIKMEANYNNDDRRYLKAKKRVEEIKGFYGHLISFVTVNIILIVLNLNTSAENIWFIWPLLGWGTGLAFHGMKVFGYSPFFGRDWEDRKMKQFLEEEQRNQKKWQ